MTLTTDQREVLLEGLGLELYDLRRMEPHDYSRRQRQANVVAFVRGLLWEEGEAEEPNGD